MRYLYSILLIVLFSLTAVAVEYTAQPYSPITGGGRLPASIRACTDAADPTEDQAILYNSDDACAEWRDIPGLEAALTVGLDIGGDGDNSAALTKIILLNDDNGICTELDDELTCDFSNPVPLADKAAAVEAENNIQALEQKDVGGTLKNLISLDDQDEYNIGAPSFPINMLGDLDADQVQFADPDDVYSADTLGAVISALRVDNTIGPNQTTGKLDWTQIVGMPEDFADGVDDGGEGSGTSVEVDIGSNGTDSSAMTKLSTIGDDNDILIEDPGNPNEFLMDFGLNWPEADNALTCDLADEASALTGFSGVTETTPQDDDILHYDTGAWVNVAPPWMTFAGGLFTGKVTQHTQALTIADSGNGSPAADSATTLAGNILRVTCSDADGCNLTLSETNAVNGQVVAIENASANPITFIETADVVTNCGVDDVILNAGTVLYYKYNTNIWTQQCSLTNGFAGIPELCTGGDFSLGSLPNGNASCNAIAAAVVDFNGVGNGYAAAANIEAALAEITNAPGAVNTTGIIDYKNLVNVPDSIANGITFGSSASIDIAESPTDTFNWKFNYANHAVGDNVALGVNECVFGANGILCEAGTSDAIENFLSFPAQAGSDQTGTIIWSLDKLSALAATTSAELLGVISDESGSGKIVADTDPLFVTQTRSPLYRSTNADPADNTTGAAFGNAETICWEASPAGTDVCVSADSSEVVQITGGGLDAADITSGTIGDTRLPSSMANKTFTGTFVIPSGAEPTINSSNNLNVDTTKATLDYYNGAAAVKLQPVTTLFRFLPTQAQNPATNFGQLDARNNHPVLKYDQTTSECNFWTFTMPPEYLGGNLTVNIWTISTAATSGNLQWDVSFERMGTSQDIDSDSFAAVQSTSATTVNGTSGIPNKQTAAFTSSQIDGLVAGELARMQICRNIADTLAEDGQILYATITQ